MNQIFVYADSLSWGIVPGTRDRFRFDQRWPGVMEIGLVKRGCQIRVIEDCLNGRRTVWDDPFNPGRNGSEGLQQRIEINSPLSLVMLFLGTNDFQTMHAANAWQSAQGIAVLCDSIRKAPIEPGMPIPDILVISPPPIQKAKGPISPKFVDAESKSIGLADEISNVADRIGVHFFDAGSVTETSRIDGVHLDEDQHRSLGLALAEHTCSLNLDWQ